MGIEEGLTLGGVELKGKFKKFIGDYAISTRAKGVLYVAVDTNTEL